MQELDSVKLKVDWDKGFIGRISILDGDGSPEQDWVLLDVNAGDLTKDRFRQQVIRSAIKKLGCESNTSPVEATIHAVLMQEIEKRAEQLNKQPAPAEPKMKKARFQLMPDQAFDTDLANGNRLAFFHQNNLRWCEQLKSWFYFDGRRWVQDITRMADVCARNVALVIYDEAKRVPLDQQKPYAKHARDSQNANRIAAMQTMAKSMLSVLATDFDTHDYLFACENGVIDLRNGCLIPFDARMYLTKMSPVTFDSAAVCPAFSRFINQITCGRPDLADYLQRLLGMCLTGDITYHALPIFWGAGCNGKSTLFEVVKAILGEFASTAPESLLMAGRDEHPTELADLQGRRLVIGSETDEGKKLRTSLVKRLTGDNTIKGRRMRCDYIEFRRTNKTILVTNNKPRLSEVDDAMRRRIKLVPFEFNAKTAGVEDSRLLDKLLAEKSGILNWLLAGCLRWQREGMNEPACILAANEDYFDEQNPLTEFIEQRCDVGPNASVVKGDLWRAYQQWSSLDGVKFPLSQVNYYRRVGSTFGEAKKVRGADSGQVRVFYGIGLKSPASTSFNPRETPTL